MLAFVPDATAGVAAYAITDHQRGQPLVYMLAMCAAIIVVFGRWRGFTAIIGLGVTFAVLLLFVIPGILNGQSPLTVAIVGSSAIMFAVLYLTHGVNVHTSVAILGTLAALVVTGLLGAAFTATTHLTGFGNEETLYLSILQGNVDMRGLLLAGIIIGALGVLDDLTVTQAATVAELAGTARSRLELYRAATRVGRAHVASAVNTHPRLRGYVAAAPAARRGRWQRRHRPANQPVPGPRDRPQRRRYHRPGSSGADHHGAGRAGR